MFRFRILAMSLILAVLPTAFAADLRENEILLPGGGARSGDLWVSSPSLRIRQGMPASAFAFVKAPGGATQYAFLIVIKGEEGRKTLAPYSSTSTSDGSKGRSAGYVDIAGKRVAFEYELAFDPANAVRVTEKLTLDGKAIDLSKGRVLLVDPTGKELECSQLQADLPDPKSPTTPDELDAAADKQLDLLKKEHAAIRTFLK